VETDLSHSQVYQIYRRDGGTAGKLVFGRAMSRAHLKRAKHDRVDYFSCSRCLDARERVVQLLLELEVVASRPGYNA